MGKKHKKMFERKKRPQPRKENVAIHHCAALCSAYAAATEECNGCTEENGSEPQDRIQIPYNDIPRENADFEKYYKMQNICSEEDFALMMESLKQDLPSAFRITGCSKSESKLLLDIVESQLFKDLINSDSEGEDSSRKPFCLPWYPNRLGWQIQITRKDIRRSEAFFKLHNFLITETGSGNINRQETVSMIPPLLLDIQSHHKILDMCAAPGSKTAQLIELLHHEEGTIPEGFVVANDVDNKRCYMLVHQSKRLNSPSMMIVNHDASALPNFFVSDKGVHKMFYLTTVQFRENVERLTKCGRLSRILCDVPCTGDGTLRKNPDIWLKWNAANGNNLHGLQFRILRRGLEMLNVGGRIVYSTCSLNPIENEAVIVRILTEFKGAVELIDVSGSVPGLKFLPGISHWTPASKDNVGYSNFDQVPVKYHTQVRPTLFPPKPEEASQFHLDRCLRLLPHLQDTGGFFVAVLEKKSPLPFETRSKPPSTDPSKADESEPEKAGVCVEKSSEECTEPKNGTIASKVEACSINGNKNPPELDDGVSTNFEPLRKRKRISGFREDPFVFFEDDEPVWASIRDFYDLRADFPKNCLLTRCLVGKKKNIYLTSPTIKNLVDNNHERIKAIFSGLTPELSPANFCMDTTLVRSMRKEETEIINTGVKTFVRCDYKKVCDFRLSQEGLPTIAPFIGIKRRIRIAKSDLLAMLACDPKAPPEFHTLDPMTQEAVKDVEVGCCLLEYRSNELNLDLTGWRGKCSLKAYIPSTDIVHYIRLLGGDVSKYVVNKFKKDAGTADCSQPEDTNLETVESVSDVKAELSVGANEVSSEPMTVDEAGT